MTQKLLFGEIKKYSMWIFPASGNFLRQTCANNFHIAVDIPFPVYQSLHVILFLDKSHPEQPPHPGWFFFILRLLMNV
jgi:hypothetical protein